MANDIVSLKIKNTILDILQKEDIELRKLGYKGIFFLPELAITYLVGKELVKEAKSIWGYAVENWWPELSANKVNTGSEILISSRVDEFPEIKDTQTDLILQLENKNLIIFELKTRCNIGKYVYDIKKLYLKNPDIIQKYFCALMDCNAGQELYNNETILKVEELVGPLIERVTESHGNFEYFTTMDHSKPNKQISCVVGIWQVK